MSNLLSDDDPRLESLCKKGAGAECCRWLSRGGKGFFCAKLDFAIARYIEEQFAAGRMNAQGDNCPGLAPTELPIDLKRFGHALTDIERLTTELERAPARELWEDVREAYKIAMAVYAMMPAEQRLSVDPRLEAIRLRIDALNYKDH